MEAKQRHICLQDNKILQSKLKFCKRKRTKKNSKLKNEESQKKNKALRKNTVLQREIKFHKYK